MMEKKKKSLEFNINPLWKFLQDNYNVEEAFKMFGPYRGANILPKIIDKNTIEVIMPLVLSNTNYVGTQFGGSLYSMCDPFYMFLLMWNLGEDYMVWDKSAKIEFIKPGRSTVKVIFHLPDSEFEDIKNTLKTQKKISKFYTAEIKDEEGNIISRLEKELYIRKLV
jgi:acyl-coenzyme A thioesterase PaaI-like protein